MANNPIVIINGISTRGYHYSFEIGKVISQDAAAVKVSMVTTKTIEEFSPSVIIPYQKPIINKLHKMK